MTIDTKDLDLIKREQTQVGAIVTSFQHIRQEQILKELSVGANARKRMLVRFNRWLKLLEKKIFDPAFIDHVPLDKLLSLLKFTATVNVKTISSMSKLDEVMVKYFNIIAASLKGASEPTVVSSDSKELNAIKKDIISKIQAAMTTNCDEGKIIEERRVPGDVLHNNDNNSTEEQISVPDGDNVKS